MKKLIDQFNSARCVSVPLIGIQTPDQTATVALLVAAAENKRQTRTDGSLFPIPPMMLWDSVRGIVGLNKQGAVIASSLVIRPAECQYCHTLSMLDKCPNDKCNRPVAVERTPGKDITDPILALVTASNFPALSVLFFLNAQRYIGETGVNGIQVVQAISNLRNEYQENTRTLILMGPELKLPIELAQDVMIFDEPYPDEEQLAQIVGDIYAATPTLKKPDNKTLVRIIDAVRGLAPFTAEQVLALSLTSDGMDLSNLWERKRQEIGQTPGLSIHRGKETLEQVKGVKNLDDYIRGLADGIALVVFVDEIEKMFAGMGTDTSGTSQEMAGRFLTWTEEKDDNGDLLVVAILLIGPAGTGKSLIAKATGNQFGKPTILASISNMKDSYVGKSQQNMDRALKVINSVAGGKKILLLATCNNLGSLTPEMRSRFCFGTFFVDLPDKDAREALWKQYTKQYELTDKDRPEDEGWTGREIRNCCMIAQQQHCSLKRAATFIAPIAESDHEVIDELRHQADGRFISANKPGKYVFNKTITPTAPPALPSARQVRSISLPGKEKNN